MSARCAVEASLAGRAHLRARIDGSRVDAYLEPHDGPPGAASNVAMRVAERVVADVLGVQARHVRVAPLHPSGRPVALVHGETGSLSVSVSHVAGAVGVAVSPRARVGVDLVVPADAGPGLDSFFTHEELALVRSRGDRMRGLLWAAKEAAYKAAGLDCEFRPRLVSILGLTGESFAWTLVERHAEAGGRGVVCEVDGVIMGLATRHDRHGSRRMNRGDRVHREVVACS